MRTTLLKFLMIAAVAPSMTLTQEPPTPPVAPRPAEAPRAARPALPPRPAAMPSPNWDFKYDLKYDLKLDFDLAEVKHNLEMAHFELENHKLDIQPHLDLALEGLKFDLNYQGGQRELEKAQRDAQRAMEQSQRELQREMEKNQREWQRETEMAQRELQRAQMDMQRSLGKFGGEDKFMYAQPRQGWAKNDPADSLYRTARESLNRGEYRRAATSFGEVVKKYPQSSYALDSQYWEAFARYRAGTTDDLKQAQKLLEDPKIAGLRQNEYNVDVRGLRARILAALASRGDAAAARTLQAEQKESPSGVCDREEVSVRGEALNALGQMDPASALPIIKKVLARRDECTVELRRRALYLLNRTPTGESVQILLDVAKNDTDQDIRREAMSTLSRTAGDQAVPMLEEMLKTSDDIQTQRSAVSALGSIDTEKARKAVRAIIERTDVQENVRAEAISTLSRDRDNRVMTADDKAYLRSLYAKMETTRLKQAVLSAVSRVEAPENEAWLLTIARNADESPSLRSQAIERLGRMTTVSFAEIGKLYEIADSRAMRQQILRALSERKEPEAVDKLVEIAKKDTDPNIRSYAIQILSRSNNPKALQALKDLLP
jgi:HEAT repeat protein